SDVLEHLCNPHHLILNLVMMLTCAPLLVLSTPDRLRTYGYDHSGEPSNKHHTREWTLDELTAWLQSYGFCIEWRGWTLSNNVDREKNTCLLVVSTGKRAYNLGEIDKVFEVEKP